MNGPRVAILLLAALAASTPGLPAQVSPDSSREPSPAARRSGDEGSTVLRALPVAAEELTLDGHLDELVWQGAPAATDFVQFQPDEGAPASQRTEARVLYGSDALYVGIRAFDTAPDSIVGQLTRRDQGSYSDDVGVIIDSYFDRRTAFQFSVNPVGVKGDVYRFNDTEEDGGWDAVWDVATAVDAQGWSAEFRIPYSQLRFEGGDDLTWGINFFRSVARLDEISAWAPVGRSDAAIVSRLGELRGLRGIDPPRRLELTPYTLTRAERRPGSSQDPFYESTDMSAAVGGDLKYGLTSNLTLDVTINPDFGQVEADPAQVNLSAFETFYPERRPFFVEGANLFSFSIALGDGDGANESLFYSRRVGRPPQGSPNSQGGYVDAADETTILGAMKLSGKTAGGWSIGTLVALTEEETAEVARPGEDVVREPVEPLSTHAVARVARDFREGRTSVGIIGTAVTRDRDVADDLLLRRSAFTGGADFRHRFGDDRYLITGYVLGSHIRGSEDALARTQLSSARYFQRPDADHVEFDPTRTSLSGFSSSWTLGKITGGHWRWSGGFQTRSPGFETNDAGYMRESDFTVAFGYVGYDQSAPQGPFRRWRVNLNGWTSYSYGGERYNSGGNVNGNFQLSNFWSGFAGVNYEGGGLSNSLLRGGPAMIREPSLNGWTGVSSDPRHALGAGLNVNWNVRPESDSWRINVSPGMNWRPSGRAQVGLGAFLTRNQDEFQWVGRMGSGEDAEYLHARLDQTTVGLTGRVDFAFSPTLSLQLYAQPFVSAGSYDRFKRVSDPRGEHFEDRVEAVEVELGDDGYYRADLDGDGETESWRDPDFNFKQFRSNTVLRWEYQPGSVLYLVWAQGRDHYVGDGSFEAGDAFGTLFDVHPENIFMVKVSYWLNP